MVDDVNKKGLLLETADGNGEIASSLGKPLGNSNDGGVLSLGEGSRSDDFELEYRTAMPLILSGSPRLGNSLFAAKEFYLAYQQTGVCNAGHTALPDAELLQMRDFHVEPCIACGICDVPPYRCPFSESDDSDGLFSRLLRAPFITITAPVYFYAMPSRLKGFLDRFQSWYNRRLGKDPIMLDLPKRPAYIILVAGRSVGNKLFDSMLISLKYALRVFNFIPQEPLLLRGLDGPQALQGKAEYRVAVARMGRSAAETLRQSNASPHA